MNITVETILNEDSMKLVNKAISYINTYRTLEEVALHLRFAVNSLGLSRYFICGKGSDHIWLSRASDGERILLITD